MVREQAIVDLIDVGEVVDGGVVGSLRREAGILGLAIGIVEADLVLEDAVETDGLEVGGLLHGAQVFAIALAQREDGATGAEGLLPEMRERSCGGFCVDDDVLLGMQRIAARHEDQTA